MNIQIVTDDWDQYSLLDSGNGRKLEQFGDRLIIRSEPRAWWQPSVPATEWSKASAEYVGGEDKGTWDLRNPAMDKFWILNFDKLNVKLKFTPTSKHVGIFPEQSRHWRFISDTIKKAGRPVNVLNLFGYTGMGTIVSAEAGAKVTHVDGSKVAVIWARDNQAESKLLDKPIRWIVDDVLKYVKREVKRGVKYDAIILDPPAFGRGPQGQVWKIEKELPELLDLCRELLSDNPLFIILTAYSIDSSSISIANLLEDKMKGLGGEVEYGELALKQKNSERMLPLSIFSIWKQ